MRSGERDKTMSANVVVVGYGAVGRETVKLLADREGKLRVAQRSHPRRLPIEAEYVETDVLNPESARRACEGADAAICCLGFPYDSRIWQKQWPKAMENLLAACEKAKARFIFADNLYMYGPQTEPLVEDMPLTDYGKKPKVRAEITKLWQAAHSAGRVEAVAVRASDFYGPDVSNSVLSNYGVKNLLKGEAAVVPFPAIHPHDVTYVPDFARALVTLLDAPSEDYGQAWHAPNAPAQTYGALIGKVAELAGVEPQMRVIPELLLQIGGMFDRQAKELLEMRFQVDRPYIVNSEKFSKRFWADATSFEDGLKATIAFYRQQLPPAP
jgi:nucleoside-diphosphate-sugar epimerase